MENAAWMDEGLLGGLRQLQHSRPEMGDTRGRGLIVACEMPDTSGDPWTDPGKSVVRVIFGEGPLLLTCGSYENAVR